MLQHITVMRVEGAVSCSGLKSLYCSQKECKKKKKLGKLEVEKWEVVKLR